MTIPTTVMVGGWWGAILLSFDLIYSLKHMQDKGERNRLILLFSTLVVLSFIQSLTTLLWSYGVMCNYFLITNGFAHYSIKMLVAYSYGARLRVFLSVDSVSANPRFQYLLHSFFAFVFLSWAVNIVKLFAVYEDDWDDVNKVCKLNLHGAWSVLDEVLFGAADVATQLLLAVFYFTHQLSEGPRLVLKRVQFFSVITCGATFYAIFVNAYDPANGIASSVVDVITDQLSMMKLYTTKVPSVHGNKGSNRGTSGVYRADKQSRQLSKFRSRQTKDQAKNTLSDSISVEVGVLPTGSE